MYELTGRNLKPSPTASEENVLSLDELVFEWFHKHQYNIVAQYYYVAS